MNKFENKKASWTICLECQGRGKKTQKPSKKARIKFQLELDEFEKNNGEGKAPNLPKGHINSCKNCAGSGILQSENFPSVDYENFPRLAIVGGGIGGVALAVACLHRGIPFTLYERDSSFDARSQGYGLTLQQASKAIQGLGIFSFKNGLTSKIHLVHNTDGKVIGEWGMRKWLTSEPKENSKRRNIHIARQSLRLALLEQLGSHDVVKWGYQLIDFKESENECVELQFLVDGKIKFEKADLLVGADGFRGAVRNLMFPQEIDPLRYLGCIVILGICPLSSLENLESPLLDGETVFQTVNGNERIYVMPFDSESVMWQLSFPMEENEAKELSFQGAKALKEEACRRTQWHDPIPQIMLATKETQITGYPVYDREILKQEMLSKWKNVTLIGDAAHPMSPFKGQGANQALLDALALARGITLACQAFSNWRELGLRDNVLTKFESEMLERSASKVKDSAEAAMLLHSEIVLHDGDKPRGRGLKRKH